MDILIDTHVLLWWLADDPRLSGKARELIADPANAIAVSAATAWEIAIKQALGKLVFDGDLEVVVGEQGFQMLPITFAHAAGVRQLPEIHRDPFDRMLVAQARAENRALLSADPVIASYPVNVIAA